jgi:signal transduction histidine kinase
MIRQMKDKIAEEKMATIRHDIRNQLSNIQLAIEQLKYEVPDATEDYLFYLETISISCSKINTVIKDLQ